MQIQMLISTTWNHEFFKAGDGPEKTDKLPEEVKKRWVNRKIAREIGVVDDGNGGNGDRVLRKPSGTDDMDSDNSGAAKGSNNDGRNGDKQSAVKIPNSRRSKK